MEPEVGRSAVAYARRHHPLADLVVVGGSAARTRRQRSDIDLLVLGPAAMFPPGGDEAAHTDRWRGELFEVFACTEEAFRRHQVAGAARFRPVSGFLLVDGVVVVDRGRCGELIAWTRDLLAAGPTVPATELAQRRYGVTNTLDDLLDAEDPAEAALLAGLLVHRLGELVLLANGRWIASGRHLLVRLHDLHPDFAEALGRALADRDVGALESLTLDALAPLGGRLMEGHVR